jgi:hypothetical protein
MHRGNRRSLLLGYEILSEGFVMVLLHGGSPKGGRTQRRPLGRLPQRHRIFSLSICAELAQSIDISDALAIVLIFQQHCTNHAPECLCKLSLLYDVASNVASNLDSIEGRIDRDQRQSCALNVAPQLVQAAKGYGGSRPKMNASIRTRLIVLVLAAVLPVLLVAAWFLMEGVHEDYARAGTAAVNAARLSAARVDDYINGSKSLLLAIGPSVSSDPADVEKNDALFRAIKGALPQYTHHILAFDLKGNNIGLSLTDFDRSQLSNGGRSYFKAALEGRVAVSDPIRSRLSGAWIAVIESPLLDDAGAVRGTVSIGTQLEGISEIIQSASLPPGSAVRITSAQGIIVAGSDNPDWIGRDVSDNPIVRRHLEIGDASQEAVWLDGVTRITASVKMSAVPWDVTLGLPVDATFAAASEEVGWELSMSALAVAAAFLVTWRLSSGIAGPIRQLQHAAAVVGAGKFDHRSRVRTTGEWSPSTRWRIPCSASRRKATNSSKPC